MKWKYKILGNYVHVRVFMNGALCGALTFQLGEFNELQEQYQGMITFEKET